MRDTTINDASRDDPVATATAKAIAKTIADMMAERLLVCDVDGAKIGVVRRYSLEAGYMEVETPGLARQELYLPFHLIQSITPHEISLRVPKDALTKTDAYLLPPAAGPLVEERTDPSTGRTEAVLTHQVQSGYDGQLVQVAPVSLDELLRTISVGMTVEDVDGAYVGEVTQVDRAHSLLTAKSSLTEETVRTVPFSMVAGADPDQAVVTLLVPTVALEVEMPR